MADGYWRYADPRQQLAEAPTSASLKRPRPEYGDMPVAPEMLGYYPRNDAYLRNGLPYVAADTGSSVGGGVSGRPIDGPRLPGHAGMDSRVIGYSSGRIEAPLPPEASNTLFVEGLPADCTRREASHIFRPFVGFQEVRLVTKDSKQPGRDSFLLCFADFTKPSQAAVALDALQGYCFDEYDRGSARLRLQFARFPGLRSSARSRSRR